MLERSDHGPRAGGVLLHPTSLPGPGVGDAGETATAFVDWLADAGQRVWQILPLVPVDSGGSPYNGLSALAGNPLLVSPAGLIADGLIKEDELQIGWRLPLDRVDYPAVVRWKDALFSAAFERFTAGDAPGLRDAFADFRRRNDDWLPDYTLFRALRAEHDEACWTAWPDLLRRRDPAALSDTREALRDQIDRFAFQQFLFHRDWARLRAYAHHRDIRIIGDLPIFIAHDSADVWSHPELFRLRDNGEPEVIAGVPPDYFSATGQLWGNPLYRWDRMHERGYRWWVQRIRRTLELVDLIRIDHFRGFEAYWEVPAGSENAVGGRWVPGPGEHFFRAVEAQLGELPLIAEDLGLITPEVDALRDHLGLPGMRVLQFAFDGEPNNPHLPENYPDNAIAYTGTHDNDTIVGWFRAISPQERERVVRWLGDPHPDHWSFVEAVYASPADLAVVPLQDLIGATSEARMNTPGVASDNWTWRIHSIPSRALAHQLLDVSRRTGRA